MLDSFKDSESKCADQDSETECSSVVVPNFDTEKDNEEPEPEDKTELSFTASSLAEGPSAFESTIAEDMLELDIEMINEEDDDKEDSESDEEEEKDEEDEEESGGDIKSSIFDLGGTFGFGRR